MPLNDRALIIVDMQNDFVSAAGSLHVPDAGELVAPIVELADSFPLVVATQDWHPADHCSFNAQGGPFPAHCIGGEWGADLVPQIQAFAPYRCLKALRQDDDPGMNGFEGSVRVGPESDYSSGQAKLARFLDARGVKRIVVVGVTGEYCVPETAIGGVQNGFDVTWPLAYSKSLSADDEQRAVRRAQAVGVRVV